MDSKIKRLYGCYNQLVGKPIKMDSFDNRILFQKVVYFLNAAGVKFDYNFTWYIRGPYASTLATDGFNISKNSENLKNSDLQIDCDENQRINRIKKEFPDINNLEKAELYASIIYFMKQGCAKEPLVSLIIDYKPWYSKKVVKDAVKKIEKSHLFN